MKQQVKRINLSGEWTKFEFENKARRYFVKNYSNNDIFVSFENNDDEDECFKIRKGFAEEVAISYNRNTTGNSRYDVNELYVKGTGEVEVEQLDF